MGSCATMGGHKELEDGTELKLDFNKLTKVAAAGCDVVPVVVQDARTGEVLIVAYANQAALDESFKQRVCCLWSTSRNEMWVKGKTSGDVLELVDIRVNCEQNSLLYLVRPVRKGACHTKDAAGDTRVSCYYRKLEQGKLTEATLPEYRTNSARFAGLLSLGAAVTALVAIVAVLKSR